jgi:hypothetical protein
MLCTRFVPAVMSNSGLAIVSAQLPSPLRTTGLCR